MRFAHDIEGMHASPRNGRNPFEKPMSAAADSSSETCRSSATRDPGFQTALRLAEGRTVVAPAGADGASSSCFKFFLPKFEPGHIVLFTSQSIF